MTWRFLRSYLSEHNITYREYLLSDHWREVKVRFRKSKLNTGYCYACGGRDHPEIHHKSYRRIGRERLGDLCLLCDECHNRAHAIMRERELISLWALAKKVRKERQKQGLFTPSVETWQG